MPAKLNLVKFKRWKDRYTELDLIGESNPELIETSLRRSDRVPHQPNRYYNFLIRDDDPIELNENDDDRSPIWKPCKGPTPKNSLRP